MENIDDLLIATCRTMIKTVLACLENATRGTIYKIGKMPELTAVRLLSGGRRQDSEELNWGLPTASEYNPPGKNWEQYRDQPGRVLEAMGWCVETQTSWTAEDPKHDPRSVRKQLAELPESEFHMEPVLVRKKSLYTGSIKNLPYPADWQGNPIWTDTQYVVAAVVKIHFRPGSLKNGDRQTKIIRNLAQSLGTELLSLWFREKLYRASKDFARQRLQSCEILAHELRNTLVKLGFVFTALNAQIAILRESWEDLLKEQVPGLEWKQDVLGVLCDLLIERSRELSGEFFDLSQGLLLEQKELAIRSLSPLQEQQWISNKLYPKWGKLLSGTDLWNRLEIEHIFDRLSKSLRTGMDFDFAVQLNGYSVELLKDWSRLAYLEVTSGNLSQLDEVIALVENPQLPICHKEQMLRVLKSLKALVHTIPEVEEKISRILQSLRYGSWAEDLYTLEPDSEVVEFGGETGLYLAD